MKQRRPGLAFSEVNPVLLGYLLLELAQGATWDTLDFATVEIRNLVVVDRE
jgi:hypothetical protein